MLYLSWILNVANVQYNSYRGYFRPNGAYFLCLVAKEHAPDFDTYCGSFCHTEAWLLKYITMHLPQDVKYNKSLKNTNLKVIFI
jgi:hypothetical protein